MVYVLQWSDKALPNFIIISNVKKIQIYIKKGMGIAYILSVVNS